MSMELTCLTFVSFKRKLRTCSFVCVPLRVVVIAFEPGARASVRVDTRGGNWRQRICNMTDFLGFLHGLGGIHQVA
jgi:hypothetical protein